MRHVESPDQRLNPHRWRAKILTIGHREVPGLMCSFWLFWMIVMVFQSLPIHLI